MKLTLGSTQTKAIATVILIALLCLAPMALSEFRLGLLGKFLAFAILAMGLDLIWGYTGILSLGHGVYFGLGAYCMAMHLKLVTSDGGLPDFMSWSGVEKLPWFWAPFHSAGAALLLAIAVPTLVALFLGYLTFRNRIRGSFFSILSQALVIITVTLFVGQQGYTGGSNGLTSFSTFLGMPVGDPATKTLFYYVTVVLVGLVICFCLWLTSGKLGNILIAIRDSENRVRFLGYNPVAYKVFIYCVSAALAGLAGVMFVLHEGIISPAQMGIVPSIEMVLWVAVGGRATIFGAIIGTILTNSAKTTFSEAYPDWWPILIGAMFIVVTMFLPKGIVGSIHDLLKRRKKTTSSPASPRSSASLAATAGTEPNNT
ncbi:MULTISPECIES: urea ABC transporter permease subunit UrtC [Paenibacillus]|uniref:urea ABC transporter permease subunit UrtC n=1 Tax=Paenibacillus TaxID=44249 RepID=UPI001143010A|nr:MULTISPECIES: urea ABC transporter permease subunit UrtC [unclassified Paenibacillus]